jgi:hypothetical protein
MTRVEIAGDHLRVVVEGVDKVLSLKSSIEVPLSHVVGVAASPESARGFHGLRLPGTFLPGVVTAGSFFDGQWLFVDVHDPDRAVKIDLDHEHYAALIVQVADPAETVRIIGEAIAQR